MLTRRSLLVTTALLLALAAGNLRAQVNVSTLGSDGPDREYILSFGEGGEKLSDVLDVFKDLLAMPVDYLPEEVGGKMVRIDGPQHIAADHVRDFIESLLERHGYWCWDDVSAGSSQLVVRMKSAGSRGSASPGFTPRVVSLEELGTGPQPRTPLYTVAFPLKHSSAINMMTVFSASLDGSVEKLRCTDSNVLLVTATRAHLLQIRDSLAAIDIPAPGAPATDAVAALEQRLASIEQRLVAIEARLAALEPKSEK